MASGRCHAENGINNRKNEEKEHESSTQRVTHAQVTVEEQVVGKIDTALPLLGVKTRIRWKQRGPHGGKDLQIADFPG